MDIVFVSPEIYPIKGSFIKNLQTRSFMIFVRGYLFLIFFCCWCSDKSSRMHAPVRFDMTWRKGGNKARWIRIFIRPLLLYSHAGEGAKSRRKLINKCRRCYKEFNKIVGQLKRKYCLSPWFLCIFPAAFHELCSNTLNLLIWDNSSRIEKLYTFPPKFCSSRSFWKKI